jgi:hypothetical protein
MILSNWKIFKENIANHGRNYKNNLNHDVSTCCKTREKINQMLLKQQQTCGEVTRNNLGGNKKLNLRIWLLSEPLILWQAI